MHKHSPIWSISVLIQQISRLSSMFSDSPHQQLQFDTSHGHTDPMEAEMQCLAILGVEAG